MKKTERRGFTMKQDLIRHNRDEQSSPSISSFTPKYLSLHVTTNDARNIGSDTESIEHLPSKLYVDVALVSEEGEVFLCNKLFLIR